MLCSSIKIYLTTKYFQSMVYQFLTSDKNFKNKTFNVKLKTSKIRDSIYGTKWHKIQ